MFSKTEKKIVIPAAEELRILQLTDMQVIDASQMRCPDRLSAPEIERWAPENAEMNCYSHIRDVVAQTSHHLIILTGDIVYGEFDDSGRVLHEFVDFMDTLEIPWAPVWGNHDLESAAGLYYAVSILEGARNCLFSTETEDISDGTGNYAVRIYRGEKLYRIVYMLDSHGCRKAYDEYARIPKSITEGQIQMIERIASECEAEARETVPAIAAWHIPTAEFFEAYEELGYENKVGTKIGVTVKAHKGDFGVIMEEASAPSTRPERFLERLKKCGVVGVFVGHHHNINTSVFWQGIRWTMGLKTGTYDYHINGALGGTLITFKGDEVVVNHVPTLIGY